jgi:hypothetical protein
MKNNKIRIRWPGRKFMVALAFISTGVVLSLGFQNCGGYKPSAAWIASLSQAVSLDLASSGQLIDDCMDRQGVDACLFLKSPVTQKGSALESGTGELTSLQRYAVRLPALDGSGFLRNASFSVQGPAAEKISLENGSWKFPVGDSALRLAHISAYYWLTMAAMAIKNRTGEFYAEGRNIKVVVNDDKTGWSSSDNSIRLEVSADGRPIAFDAGVMIHLLAQANLHYATLGKIDDMGNDTHHMDCGPTGGETYQNDCCQTKDGCSRAVAAGASDYLVALMFPDAPTVGEYWANRGSGLGFCNISRDLRMNANLSASEAFGACRDFGVAGEIYNMGTLYASIWWEIRKQLKQDPAATLQFDQLYMRHLSALDGADTITTAVSKAKQIDARDFAGRFTQLFDAEIGRRGLNP